MPVTLDLNADLGEGCGSDADLMPLINRANIACGGHAGDDISMLQAITLALKNNVAIGAHPAYPDRERFGRVETGATAQEIEIACIVQLDRFAQLARQQGARVAHVKPHGALYHRLMQDAEAANAFLRAVTRSLGRCAVMGLPGSVLQQRTQHAGLPFLAEMFADRHYEADGSLTPRSHPQALITDPDVAIAQVLSVRDHQHLQARTGETVCLQADTVCVHGDNEHALAFVRALHRVLHEGVTE